jgi:hypothetical protein
MIKLVPYDHSTDAHIPILLMCLAIRTEAEVEADVRSCLAPWTPTPDSTISPSPESRNMYSTPDKSPAKSVGTPCPPVGRLGEESVIQASADELRLCHSGVSACLCGAVLVDLCSRSDSVRVTGTAARNSIMQTRQIDHSKRWMAAPSQAMLYGYAA